MSDLYKRVVRHKYGGYVCQNMGDPGACPLWVDRPDVAEEDNEKKKIYDRMQSNFITVSTTPNSVTHYIVCSNRYPVMLICRVFKGRI